MTVAKRAINNIQKLIALSLYFSYSRVINHVINKKLIKFSGKSIFIHNDVWTNNISHIFNQLISIK